MGAYQISIFKPPPERDHRYISLSRSLHNSKRYHLAFDIQILVYECSPKLLIYKSEMDLLNWSCNKSEEYTDYTITDEDW